MAYAYSQELPNDWAAYEQIVAESGADDHPPLGLIVHTAAPSPNGVHIISVWESREAFEDFARERLGPARARIVPDSGPPISKVEMDVQHLVRG
jgi:hypothetical protein